MERLTLIVESPDAGGLGTRISCMLNPEHIVLRRSAGIAPRRSGSGVLAGHARSDAPLLHTGGGRTEVELQLLFDVDLVPQPVVPVAPAAAVEGEGAAPPPVTPAPRRDVREYTRPLWDLAENPAAGTGPAPRARVVLGKWLNMLVVVEAVAERFERFDASGTPGRSWMSVRLVRVPDPNPPAPATPPSAVIPPPEAAAQAAATPAALHTVVGGGAAEPGEPPAGGETLPEIAARYFGGRAALWRWIAEVNLLDDVVWPEPGRALIIPPPPEDVTAGESP